MPIRKQEITVTEKALEPVIPAGATVVCSEQISPEPGDFVVYFPESGVPLFRRWRPGKDDSVLLEALNKDADSYRSSELELKRRGKLFVILSMNRIFRALPEESRKETVLPAVAAEEFLTFQEAMAILKVKRTRMYELLQTGKIKASKLGRLWRIERGSLNEFLRNCRTNVQ